MKTPSPDDAPRPRKKKRRPREDGEAAPIEAAPSERPSREDNASRAIRRGPLHALLALLALGVVVAVYLTVAHLELFHGTGSFHSLCNFGERLSCDAVNTSEESELFGVAIAVFAVPAYVVLAFLIRAALRGPEAIARTALASAHAIAWGAALVSAWLLAVMIGKLKTLCLFCLTLDTVNVAAVVLTAVAARSGPRALLAGLATPLREDGRRLLLTGAGLGVITLAGGLAGHASLRASLEAEARSAVVAGSENGPASSAKPGGDEGPGDEPTKGARKLPTKRWEVPIDDDDASVGPKDAKVTVVQFADFQCGYCKKLEAGLAAVRKAFGSEVRFVFKHFPMNPACNGNVHNEKHAYACVAAEAGECARRQGKFWPMHAVLYGNQHLLKREDLDAHAATIGLDRAAFTACMSDPSVDAAIRKDADQGAAIKVNGTPRTFVNGRLFAGVLSEDLLTFVIRVELGQVTGKAAEAYVPPPGASSAPGPGSGE